MGEEEGKSILGSKTFWINLIALIALIVQTQFGFVIGAEEQIAIIAVINLVLRVVTKEPIEMPKCLKKE